jgi:hypothetical protein
MKRGLENSQKQFCLENQGILDGRVISISDVRALGTVVMKK